MAPTSPNFERLDDVGDPILSQVILMGDEELNKRIGQTLTIGCKRPNGIFFLDGVLLSVTGTHIFLSTRNGEQGFLLSDISKIEFRGR